MWGEARTARSGLAYRRSGEGWPVVLLHGIPGSAAAWAGVAARLPDDVEVVVPDLLGFGGSHRPASFQALCAPAQAAAVDDLLDELGIARAAVVGHDFGGPVALALAARRPDAVAAVGLLAANTFPDTPVPFPLSTVTWPVVGRLARAALFSGPSLRMMVRTGVGPGASAPPVGDYVGDGAQQRAIATIFGESLSRLAELYGPVEAHLRALDVPVFVGWGDRDPFFPVEQGRRTARAAGVEVRVYEGAGHFLPHERPDEVAADVAALAAAVAQ